MNRSSSVDHSGLISPSFHLNYQVSLPPLSALGLLPSFAMRRREVTHLHTPVTLIGEGPGFALQPLPRPGIYHQRQIESTPSLPLIDRSSTQGTIPVTQRPLNSSPSGGAKCDYFDKPLTPKPTNQKSWKGRKTNFKVRKSTSPAKSKDRHLDYTQRGLEGEGITFYAQDEQRRHNFTCHVPGCQYESFIGRAELDSHFFHTHVILGLGNSYVCNVGYCNFLASNGGKPFSSTNIQTSIDHIFTRECMSPVQREMYKILNPVNTDVDCATIDTVRSVPTQISAASQQVILPKLAPKPPPTPTTRRYWASDTP